MRVRVIGVGSAFGDDAAGPLVAQRLAEAPGLPEGVDAVPCTRPLDLIELLDGVDAAVLVDATRSGRRPGTVYEPSLDALEPCRPVSSHALGVGEALAVARALGRAPQRIAIVGIEAQAATGDGPSPPVRDALEEAGARVRERCAEFLAEARPRGARDASRA